MNIDLKDGFATILETWKFINGLCVMFNVNDSMINIIKADLYILKVHGAAYKLIISQLLKMNRWWKCTTLDCFIKLKEVHLDKLSWDINIDTTVHNTYKELIILKDKIY